MIYVYAPMEVKKDVFWVGSLDFNIRVFDIVMHTEYGTTYNSYVLKGSEKTALFEVSKESFFDEFSQRLSQATDPAAIDYIVLNHTEPDHTGSLNRLLEICPNATVVGTATALRFAKAIVNRSFNELAVKEGDTLSLGNYTLQFIMAPFLHWPDSMYTYVPENKTLFTCDSFGCHYADKNVFNDKIDKDFESFNDAYKYYFDMIMGPFKSYVLQAIDKIKPLAIETICNGHGPVIRTEPQKYIDMYKNWSTVTPLARKSVAVAYASAYGYTKKLAEKIARAIKDTADLDVYLLDIVTDDRDEIMAKINEAAGILLGSCTINGDTLPPIWEILSGINPIVHRGKLAGAFGAYGWSGEAVPNITQRFAQLRLKMPVEGLKVQFNPSDEELGQAEAFGKAFAEAVAAV